MTLDTLLVVFVGLLTAYLTELLMKRGGYGMSSDALLGVGGSLAGGALFNMFAIMPGKEWLPMGAAAFAGAIVIIVGQRAFWRART